MTSSYLKAMQLTKQLEEKAKEEKKNRQLAEAEMQEAESILMQAKASDINVAKAAELLENARNSFELKEYKDALGTATQAKEMAMKCFSDGIQSIIDSVEKLAELVREVGKGAEQGLELLEGAKSALAENEFEKAMTLAKESWSALEKVAQAHISETFSQAQSMIVLARNVGEDVAASEDLLEQARKAMESQDYFVALEHLKSCMESVGTGLSSQVEDLLDEAKGFMITARDLNADVERVSELVRRTEEEIASGDLESALSSARLARSEGEKGLNRAISDILEEHVIKIQDAEQIEADMDRSREILELARSMLKEGEYQKAIEATRELESEIYNAQFQKVLGTISQSRSKFVAANSIGADLSEAMNYLNQAKNCLKGGDFVGALDMARKADEVVDGIVKEFEDIENTIQSLEEQVSKGTEMGADLSNASASISAARESLASRDFESVRVYVKQAQEELASAMYSYATECIEVAELVISAGNKLGANMSEPEEMMRQAIDATKSGNFQKAVQLSGDATTRAEDIIRIHVSNTIASVELAMVDAENVDIDTVKSLLDSAKQEFENNAFDQAFAYADRALNMLETSQSQKAREVVSQLGEAIDIARKMNCDVEAVEEVRARCEEHLKGRDFTSALAEGERALSDARNLQYVAAERMFGEGKLAAIEAKKLGIDITDMKEALKRAKSAFSKADFYTTYTESLAAKEAAERQMEFHRKAYDAINQAAALLAEAKKNNADVKGAMSILLSAKGMFERFDYENAWKEAEKAREETEKVVARYNAASSISDAEANLKLLRDMNMPSEALEKEMADIRADLETGVPAEILARAQKLARDVVVTLEPALSNFISTAESEIMDARELNLVVGPQEELLAQAKKALESGDYAGAMAQAREAREQISEIRKQSQRAAMELKAAQDALSEGENLHADMSVPKKLLEEALTNLSQSNYKEAIDLAVRSAAESRKAIESHVADSLKAFRASMEKAKLEGINVAGAEKLLEKAQEAFNAKDYKTALAEAMKSEGELEKVGLQQEMAEKAINTAETKLKEAEAAGIFSKKAKNLVTQARGEMKAGDYVKALELAIQSGDELHMVSEEFSDAVEAMDALRAQIDMAKKVGADITIAEKLLADAEDAKKDHDYRTATEIAKEGALEARRITHGHLNKKLAGAYKLADLAGGYSLDVAGTSTLLAEAKTFLDTGKFEVAAEKIKHTLEDVRGKLASFFEEHFAQSERSMAHASEVGADIEASRELLDKARKLFSEGRYQEAMTYIEKSKDAIDLEKGFEREFIELAYQAEEIISNAKKFGINMKEAESLLAEAKVQKEGDYQQALATIRKAIDVARNEVDEFRPVLSADIVVDRVEVGQWVESDLVVRNQGKALAKDVKVSILGEISTEGQLSLDTLRGGGGEATLKLRMKMDTPGEVPVIIKLESTRIMDGRRFEDRVSDHIFVMEPKAAAPEPAVQTASAGAECQQLTATQDTKCGICMGKAKAGVEIIRCKCGKEFHALCARRFGKCPSCGTEFREKMDRDAQEDIVGDLDKPVTSAQPAPAPPEEKPAPAGDVSKGGETPAEGKKEQAPKKAVKKKVALRL